MASTLPSVCHILLQEMVEFLHADRTAGGDKEIYENYSELSLFLEIEKDVLGSSLFFSIRTNFFPVR